METALDTPRFGIVVSLSVDSRSSTANSSTVPRFIEGFRERDKFLRIISAGLCFSDTFYQEENGWTRSKKLDTFICPNYTRRGLTLSSAIKQMRFRGFRNRMFL